VIEAQSDSHAPVLVDRLVSEDGDTLGSAFGWPIRHGADTLWTHGSRVQQLVGMGLRPMQPSAVAAEGLSQTGWHLELLAQQEGWDAWAVVALQLMPEGGSQIDDFYGAFRHEANSWRAIRPQGFGRLLEWQPLEPAGDLLVSSGPRTSLIVGPNGLVTAAALASPEYLGWAQHRNQPAGGLTQLTINPFPMVEFIAEAVRFAYGVVAPNVKPSSWTIRVLGLHLQDRVPVAIRLQPGEPYFAEPRPATTSSVDASIEGTGNWDTDAFNVLELLLGRGFGVPRGEIPFAVDGTVNPETFG
jgi:hypothetical protein